MSSSNATDQASSEALAKLKSKREVIRREAKQGAVRYDMMVRENEGRESDHRSRRR